MKSPLWLLSRSFVSAWRRRLGASLFLLPAICFLWDGSGGEVRFTPDKEARQTETRRFFSTSEEGSSRRTSVETVAITYFQRCIFLRARVNDQEDLLFLLDTGANTSALDLKAAERLQIPITGNGKVEGTTGIIEVKQAQVKLLSVGAAQAKDIRITVQDLRGSLAPTGKVLDGILGYDFLRHFSLRIDFVNQTLAFFPGPSRRSPWDTASATRLGFKLDNGIPRLTARLNESVAADYRLDTGASLFETSDVYVNILEETWKQLTAKDPTLKPKGYLLGSGSGGEVKLPLGRIHSLSVGSLQVTSPYVIVQPKAGYFARKDAVGFLSNNFLEKYSPLILDYPGKALYLSPPEATLPR